MLCYNTSVESPPKAVSVSTPHFTIHYQGITLYNMKLRLENGNSFLSSITRVGRITILLFMVA